MFPKVSPALLQPIKESEWCESEGTPKAGAGARD